MKKSMVVILLVFPFCGCTNTYYYVNKVPRTPGNLSVYRECQRTVAAATGYDEYGYKDLKRKCLDTLDGMTTEFAEGDEAFNKVLIGSNCKNLDSINYGGVRAYFYYICE